MKWFIYAFKNSFNFRGRARRAEFGWFNLINMLIQIGLQIIAVLCFIGSEETGNDTLGTIGIVFSFVYPLYGLITIIPTLSVTVRRLHDLGWSGWWLLWSILICLGIALMSSLFGETVWVITTILLGLVYLVFILMLYFKDGQRFANKYGEDPKTVGLAQMMINQIQQSEALQKLVEKSANK